MPSNSHWVEGGVRGVIPQSLAHRTMLGVLMTKLDLCSIDSLGRF